MVPPPKSTSFAQTAPAMQPYIVDPTLFDTSDHPAIFNEFLKWYEDLQNFGSTTFVVHTTHTGTSHSNSLSPSILDSGAIDHINSNETFFSSIFISDYLPSITMTNGSRLSSHGFDTIMSFLRYLLRMFSMSLGFPLTSYLLVVSLVPLIVLFLLPKILFVYRSRVWDRLLALDVSLMVFITYEYLHILERS